MKISLKKRIEIALKIVENKGTDCLGGFDVCCNCPLIRHCGDVDELFLRDAEIWLESQGVEYEKG